jgi:hypothetical protein
MKTKNSLSKNENILRGEQSESCDKFFLVFYGEACNMETLTYQHREHRQVQPDNWLYEIKQKGDSQTCYVMVQNVQVRTSHLLIKACDVKLVFTCATTLE